MCGIVGMLTRSGDAGRWRAGIGNAMDLMARRGPDSAGLWTDDDACILGFRRLSILDLSPAGDQPMVTRDGRFALVFNGELYNFREIRATLGKWGPLPVDGVQGVLKLALRRARAGSFNGMFALAFYDARDANSSARDHAAIKPLYVLRHREASSSRRSTTRSGASVGGDHSSTTALSCTSTLGYLPPPVICSPAAGRWKPGAGSFDAGGSGGRALVRFRGSASRTCADAALEAVDAAVTSAVRRQLVSDVPVGVFLSGGIDSPLVAAKAQAFLGPESPLPAFTLGTNGGAHDESADAARYAEALGLRHVVRHITSDDVGLLDDVVGACGEPSDDYSILPTALVSRLAREEVKVVLSGDGGDDVFWGYPGRMIGPLAPPGRSLGARARGILRRSWEDPTARRTTGPAYRRDTAAPAPLPSHRSCWPRSFRRCGWPSRTSGCSRSAAEVSTSSPSICGGTVLGPPVQVPAEGGPGEHARLARSEGAAP